MLVEVIKKIWQPINPSVQPQQSEFLTSFPILGRDILLAFLTPKVKTQPWDSDVMLRSSVSIHDWTQLKPSSKLVRFGGKVQRPTSLAAAHSNSSMLIPLLIKTATYHCGMVCLFLQSLHIQGLVSGYIWEACKPTTDFAHTKGEEEHSRLSRSMWSKTIT